MAEHDAASVRAMVESLKSVSAVRITRWEPQLPAPDGAIEAARRLARSKLPDGVEAFYRTMNGFALEWEATAAGATDRGAAQLIPIERIFGDWKGVTWFDDLGGGGGPYRGVKPFDIFQAEACAAFWQDPDAPPQSQVYFHYFGEGLCALGYSFDEYLDRLLASRGYLYWQQTLCAEMAGNPEVARFHARMPVLFPDFAPDLFVPRP